MSQQGDHVGASSVVGEEGLDPQALTGSIGAPQGVRQPAVPPGPTGQGLTVEDLIQATVRAMMVYDEQRRRSVPSPSSPSLSGERGADNLMVNKATNKELSNLLPEFTGAGQNINVWLERIDSVQKTYQVPDDVMKLIAIGKLNKGPLEWYHSKVEFVEMDFSTLKATMRKMYAVSSDPITLRKAMERRRWKRGEKFSVYFHEKVLLGNNALVPESEMIHYVIEGFDDKSLQNQVRLMLMQIHSLEDLLVHMNNVVREEAGPVRFAAAGGKSIATARDGGKSTAVRCYNCNKEGHKKPECQQPIREKGSCFQCGSMDHKYRDCPQKKKRTEVTRSTPDSTTTTVTLIEERILQKPYTLTVRFVELEVTLDSIVDSGSPVSIICENLVPP